MNLVSNEEMQDRMEELKKLPKDQFINVLALVSCAEELEKENKQLKEQLEVSEKARKKAIEYIKSNPNVFYDEYIIDVDTITANEGNYEYAGKIEFISKLLELLNTDKGE